MQSISIGFRYTIVQENALSCCNISDDYGAINHDHVVNYLALFEASYLTVFLYNSMFRIVTGTVF